jgi:glycosyltransferase involved in cell wall biosynthesis
MNILMLGWELPPHNSGGLGVACYELCSALALKGFTIDFVLPYSQHNHDIPFMNILSATPYSVESIASLGGAYDSGAYKAASKTTPPHSPSNLRDLQNLYVESMESILKHSSPDVIHAHDWLTFEAAVRAKQLTGKPLIAHVHATEFDRSGTNLGNPVIHDIEYNALMMADRVVAVSQATKNIIAREYGIPQAKIDVLHNSINTADILPQTSDNTFAYLEQMKKLGYKVVVSLGRLTIQKGLTHLLKAAQLVVERDSKVIFLICGTGDQYYELLEMSAQLGIAENIIFTGEFLRGKAWRDAYSIGDMFVMPSVSEPFGIAPLEAIGHGTPALVSKQSGVSEVIRNMLLFDYWDHQKMADQILAVAQFDSLQHELYKNSREEFNQLSWHDVAQKCKRIYQQIAMHRSAT